jgi:hypothetical protein
LFEPVRQTADRALVQSQGLREFLDPQPASVVGGQVAERAVLGEPEAKPALQHLGQAMLDPSVQRDHLAPGRLVAHRHRLS